MKSGDAVHQMCDASNAHFDKEANMCEVYGHPTDCCTTPFGQQIVCSGKDGFVSSPGLADFGDCHRPCQESGSSMTRLQTQAWKPQKCSLQERTNKKQAWMDLAWKDDKPHVRGVRLETWSNCAVGASWSLPDTACSITHFDVEVKTKNGHTVEDRMGERWRKTVHTTDWKIGIAGFYGQNTSTWKRPMVSVRVRAHTKEKGYTPWSNYTDYVNLFC
jgi:hypothetical protein